MYALFTVADAGFGYIPYPLRDGVVAVPALRVVDRTALHHQATTTLQARYGKPPAIRLSLPAPADHRVLTGI